LSVDVLAFGGWQDCALSDGTGVINMGKSPENPSWALGVLEMLGLTAWAGLTQIGQPKAGETLVVAGASGPVGATNLHCLQTIIFNSVGAFHAWTTRWGRSKQSREFSMIKVLPPSQRKKPPGFQLGDAHIFRFGFRGALDGFHVAWFGCSTLNGGRRVIGAVGLSDFRAFWPIRA
jgi:hypothetical protein